MGNCIRMPRGSTSDLASASGNARSRHHLNTQVSNLYVQEPIVPPHPRLNHHLLGQLDRLTERQMSASSLNINRFARYGPAVNRQFVAIYAYEARTNEDLTFNKGDTLTIVDDSLGEWWLGRVDATNLQGYVPSNYLAPVDTEAANAWFFGKITRNDAERLLSLDDNLDGAFLIRQSESRLSGYALSIRDGGSIKHYRIKKTPSGLFYVSPKTPFATLEALVEHYSKNSNGLCTALRGICVRVVAPTHDLAYCVKDDWEIDRKTLTMTSKLGSGNFADVYSGHWNQTTPVAVKMLKNSLMSREEFLNEASIMKKFSHRNLVRLYAICSLEEPILIVVELMQNGSLLNYLRKGRGSTLGEKQLIDIGAQIADGMSYLEMKNYIHRDLAARNILVGERNDVKIADFGLARFTKGDEIYEAREGTRFPIKWTAPESATTGNFTIKSDIWSFGIVLYEIITLGAHPYGPNMSNAQVLLNLEKGYRLERPTSCPEALYGIMLDCWKKDPETRPTFETLHWELQDYYAIHSGGNYREASLAEAETF